MEIHGLSPDQVSGLSCPLRHAGYPDPDRADLFSLTGPSPPHTHVNPALSALMRRAPVPDNFLP